MQDMQTHYTTLGLPTSATLPEVRARYLELAKKYHPDRPGGDEEAFKAATSAYHAIMDGETGTHGLDGLNGQWPDFSLIAFLWPLILEKLQLYAKEKAEAAAQAAEAAAQAAQAPQKTMILHTTLEEIHARKMRKVRMVLDNEPIYSVVCCGDYPEVSIERAKVLIKPHAHDVFQVDDILDTGIYDLYTEVGISWLEYLTGCTRKIKYLDGTDIDIEVPPIAEGPEGPEAPEASRLIVKDGFGLFSGFGALYVTIRVDPPTQKEYLDLSIDRRNSLLESLSALQTCLNAP